MLCRRRVLRSRAARAVLQDGSARGLPGASGAESGDGGLSIAAVKISVSHVPKKKVRAPMTITTVHTLGVKETSTAAEGASAAASSGEEPDRPSACISAEPMPPPAATDVEPAPLDVRKSRIWLGSTFGGRGVAPGNGTVPVSGNGKAPAEPARNSYNDYV